MRIAVVTDSTAYIPDELIEDYNINIIPLSVIFGNESYREGIDISSAQFYQKIKESKNLPSTSQPPIGEFVKLYEELAENYDAVISIHLSSKFSGTYQGAVSAGNMVEGIDVYAYDTELSTMPQGFYAIEAAEMARQSKSPEKIIARLDEIKKTVRTYFMVDDLQHLVRGGRLSGAQAFVGSLLSIKPVLHIVDGVILPFEKIRTRKRALRRISSMLEEDAKQGKVVKVVFIHANNEKAACQLQDDFTKKYPEVETVISYFGPVIGTHLGENAIGVAWYNK